MWRWRADGRPAVYGCTLPLRLQKERPLFPTFGDEERESFFQEPKGFGSADGWPASGRPAGGGALAEEGSSTDCCLSNHRTTGCTASSCERAALRAIREHCSPGGWGEGAALRVNVAGAAGQGQRTSGGCSAIARVQRPLGLFRANPPPANAGRRNG